MAVVEQCKDDIKTLVDKLASMGMKTVVLSNGQVIVRNDTANIPILPGLDALTYLDNPDASDCLLVIQPCGREIHAVAGELMDHD